MRTPSASRPFHGFHRYLTLLGAVALMTACSRPAPPQEPVRAVKLMTVGVGALESQLEYAARCAPGWNPAWAFAWRQDRAAPGRTGPAREGWRCAGAAGSWDYQLAAEAARAQLAAATTQRDLAAADYKRYAALKDQNFISGAELERRDTALKAAQATLDAGPGATGLAGNQAAYTRLVADAAGVVTGIDAEPGQVVAAGAPVVRIAQDGARDVVFAVPEDKVAAMAPGQKWPCVAGPMARR